VAHNPHDKLFKAAFSHPASAGAEIRALLPAALVQQLDLSTLRQRHGSFVDQALSERHTDRLFSVELAGAEVLLYFLFEHQSTVDPLMPVRLLIYEGRIWDDWLGQEENKGKDRIPAILPVVLYQGPQRWEAATDLLGLIDLPPDLLAVVREHLPSFRFLLDDLSQQPDEALRDRQAGPLGTLALLLLRHARDERERFLAFLHTVTDLLNGLEDRSDQVRVFSYILEVVEVTVQEIEASLGEALDPARQEAVVTAADQLREQGKKLGQRGILVHQLGVRFGDLPESVTARVETAGEAELKTWAERVLTATTLDEVFRAE
jgi:predicted transposase/invertase (TIGR01784 family)